MKIATFNLYNFCAPPFKYYQKANKYSESDWNEKYGWINTQISQLQPDIIGFQEVFSVDALKELVSELGYELHTVDSVTPARGESQDSSILGSPVVAIAVRRASEISIMDINPIPFSDTVTDTLHVPDIEERRVFSRLPIDCLVELEQGRKLRVIIAHLKSKRPKYELTHYSKEIKPDELIMQESRNKSLGMATSLFIRTAEAASISDHVHKLLLEDNHTPIIILGDLNTELGTVDYDLVLGEQASLDSDSIPDDDQELKDELKSLKYRFKLNDAYVCFRKTDDKVYRSNYLPAERPYTYIYEKQAEVLDHIFGSHHIYPSDGAMLEVTDYIVLNDHLQRKEKTKSDHGIVMAEFEFK